MRDACRVWRDMLDEDGDGDGDGHGDDDGDCDGDCDDDECISLNEDGKDCTCLDMDVRRGEKKGRDGPIMYQELGVEIGVRRC